MYAIYDIETKLPVPNLEPKPRRIDLLTLRRKLNKNLPAPRFFVARIPEPCAPVKSSESSNST